MANLIKPGLSDGLMSDEHQVITWTNVGSASVLFCGIHHRAMSQELLPNLIHDMCSEITVLELP